MYFSPPARSRRMVIVAAFSLLISSLLSACSGVHQDIGDTLRSLLTSPEDYVLTPEQIAAFPFTGIYVRRGTGPQNFVVLGFFDPYTKDGVTTNQLHWITTDEITLVTEQGRLIRTAGLSRASEQPVLGDHDLRATSNRHADPLRCIVSKPQQCPTTWTREIDYVVYNHVKSSTVTSEFSTVADVAVELPTRTVMTTHITERGRFLSTGERFVNEFWAESDGHIVKSKQTFLPGEAPITLTQVKWIGREVQP